MVKELISQGYTVNKPKFNMNLPEKVFDFLYPYNSAEQEYILLITLDIKLNVLNTHEVTKGLLYGSLIDAREVFKRALMDNARSFILSHNHPSGDTTPSIEDIEMTKQLISACRIMSIDMLDHIIISSSGFNSLRQSTCLWETVK